MNKKNSKIALRINRVIYKKSAVAILLLITLLIAFPLRIQNIQLNGYVSDDAWWHYRHIKHIQETGFRLNPDIYEFVTLSRAMTYPPLFHYFLAYLYDFSRLFQKNLSLIDFTNYFNILAGLLYIFIIYGLSLCFSEDRLFSLIGAVGCAVSYGMIIRARAGELMPFALADLFALTGLLILIAVLKNNSNKKAVFPCVISGILFGLSALTWHAAVLIYFPLIILAFLCFILNRPNLIKSAIKLFCFCFTPAVTICLLWYLPLFFKYGLSPYPAQMVPFIRAFSVAHRLMPLKSYVLASGIGVFFVPFVLIYSFFRRNFLNFLLIFWIALAGIAAFAGWRGYIAVFPILSNITMSVGICWLMKFFFKKESSIVPIFFIGIFILVAVTGYHVSRAKLRPLNPKNPFEIRSNEKSIKMLEYLKSKYPKAIAIDHIFWSSEDEAVGDLRMVIGQYLEYLPKGSSKAIEDVSRFYFSDEMAAYKICQKYNVDLVIARSQILEPGMFNMLFYHLREESIQTSGSMLLSMLKAEALKGFELVYIDREEPAAMPFAVVYKVKKE